MNFNPTGILELYEPDADLGAPNSGTGPIDQTDGSNPVFLSSCYKYNPTKAPTTTSPTTTSSPTKAPAYTEVNGTDTGFCADSYGRSYSYIDSFEIGTEGGGSNCDPFPGNLPALAYCSTWCSA